MPTPKVAKLDFTVALDGCSWLIDYTKTDPTEKDSDNLRTIASCDGTNIYIVHYPSGLAEVYTGTYPFCREVHPQYIWLAFASRCVLSSTEGTAKPPLPIDIGIFSRNDYFCRYKWETSPDGTPDKLVFLHDGSFFSRDHVTGEVHHTRFTAPYADGYTLAVGQWLNKTNVAGVMVPTDFQFTGFGPKANASSATDLSKRYAFRCVVTNIAISVVPQIPPQLPSDAHVSDRRFTDLGYAYVMYVVTNGVWPSVNNSAVQRLLLYAPKFSTEDEALSGLGIKQIGDKVTPNQKQSRKETAKWIILSTLVFPAIYFSVRILRTRKIKP
jgi:hypothetical protein